MPKMSTEQRYCSYCHAYVSLVPLLGQLTCEWSIPDTKEKHLCYQECVHNLAIQIAIEAHSKEKQVPKEQIVTMLSGSLFEDYAPAERQQRKAMERKEREYGWEKGETPQGKPVSSIYFCPVSKESVLALDTKDIDDIINTATDSLKKGERFPLWNVTISGYDDDPRGLWQIPEVRAWCKNAQAKVPHFLCLVSEATINWYLFCLLDVEILGQGKKSMLPEEQKAMESILAKVSQEDPDKAAKMRLSFEGKAYVEVKSPAEARRLLNETTQAGKQFFSGCGVSPKVAEKLASEVGERICQAFPATLQAEINGIG